MMHARLTILKNTTSRTKYDLSMNVENRAGDLNKLINILQLILNFSYFVFYSQSFRCYASNA